MSESVALEPGWYVDPFDAGRERYHDGSGWSGRSRRIGGTDEQVQEAVRMRPTWIRLAITVPATIVLIGLFDWPLLTPALYPYRHWISLANYLITIAIVLSLAPLVGTPRGWVWVWLPVFGYRGLIVVIWRLTALPYRETTEPILKAGWRQVHHPGGNGKYMYVRDRTAS